jgi:Arc/MetJ-type ribon-helix-helix transcriptional regulator
MPVRISVRLDEATKSKLEDLVAETHKSITEIITEALDLYYQRRQQAHSDNQALLDLAGCFSGPADLSTSIKDEFAGALNDKYRGHR